MLIGDLIKRNAAGFALGGLLFACAVFSTLNIRTDSEILDAKVIRIWSAPRENAPAKIVTFVELGDGRTTIASLGPHGKVHQSGEKIRVKRYQYLFIGEGYEVFE
jgi:hypothetical protein